MQYLLTQDELDALKEKATPEHRIIKAHLEKFYTSLSKCFHDYDDPMDTGRVRPLRIHWEDLKRAIAAARKDAGLE